MLALHRNPVVPNARTLPMALPQPPHPERFLRVDEVTDLVGLSAATLYRRMAAGTFPRPVKTGGAAVRWLLSEVTQWQRALIDSRTPPRAA